MSKIGGKPILISEGLTVNIQDKEIAVSGKNASLSLKILPGIKAEIKENNLIFTPIGKSKQIISNWGTMRALAANAISGAMADFAKELIIEGIGFKAEVQGDDLILNIGYSHPVKFPIPKGIKIKTEKNTIKISGYQKDAVGEVAAKIRSLKEAEPYLGKGMRYKDEVVRRKAGKKATTSGGEKV